MNTQKTEEEVNEIVSETNVALFKVLDTGLQKLKSGDCIKGNILKCYYFSTGLSVAVTALRRLSSVSGVPIKQFVTEFICEFIEHIKNTEETETEKQDVH